MLAKSHPEELVSAEKLMREGKNEDSLKIIKNFEKKSGITDEDKLSALLLEGRIYLRTGNFQEAVRVGEIAYHLSYKLNKIPEIIESLFYKSHIMHLGKPDETLEFIHEAEILINSLEKETHSKLIQERATALIGKSWAYLYKGDYQLALMLALKGKSLCKHLDKKIGTYVFIDIIDIDGLVCYIYHARGENDYALEYAVKSVKFQKEKRNPGAIAGSLRALGNIYSTVGDLDTSIKYCNQGLSISSISNFTKYHTLLTLGRNYEIKGELDRALTYFEQADSLSKVMGYKNPFLAQSLILIGTIYRKKGDYEKAVEYVKIAQEFCEEIDFARYNGVSLFWLVIIYLEKNMLEKAKIYLIKLKELSDKTKSIFHSQAYQTAKALLLKTSRRTRNRAEAEILLNQIVYGDVVNINLHILSLVSLCEFLLEELENSNDPEVLEEINPVITRLIEIAENQHSYSILAETNLLQGRLALIKLNLDDARQYLTTAQNIANEHSLTLLARKISHEHDTLLEELDTWRSFKKTQASISKRMKLASIDNVIKRMQGKRVIEVPEVSTEEPTLLLIMDKSGVAYFNHSFVGDWDFDDLFSSFMSAFNSFSGEIFSKSIDRIKIGENTILINPIEPFLVCYIIKGQSYPAQQKLARFSDTIISTTEIWEALNRAAKTSEILELDNLPSLRDVINEIFIS